MELLQCIGDSADDSRPVGDEGSLHWTGQKLGSGFHDRLAEHLHCSFFAVPVEVEAVHDSVVLIMVDHVQGLTVIGGLDGAKGFSGEYRPVDGELAKDGLDDISAHLVKAAGGVVCAEILVFVVVAFCDIDLADAAGAVDSKNLRENADLESPVTGDTDRPNEVGFHGELSGKRIPERIEIREIVDVSQCGLHRADQWCQEESCDPTTKLLLSGSVVVPLGKGVAKRGMDDRIQQPGHHSSLVGQDVGVVERYCLCPSRCEEKAEAIPDVAPLSGLVGGERLLCQIRIQSPEAGAVIPEQPVSLGKTGKELACSGELGFIGSVYADDDLAEIGDLRDLVDDRWQSLAFELGIKARQDEGHRVILGPCEQICLKLLQGALAETVQGCDLPVLEEVGHGSPLSVTNLARA